MKERPILFSSEMVRAILDGRKTQTRRVVNPRCAYKCPFGRPGDRLWVRETFHTCPHCDGMVAYRAGGWKRGESFSWDDLSPLRPKCAAHGWKPSIHMPRWASRITLEVVNVRVERVQDITDADAIAEGVKLPGVTQYEGRARDAFKALWDSINAKRGYGWDVNPRVRVVEFRVLSTARAA